MKLKPIRRKAFETSGFRTIELARGIIEFPDGRHSRYNIRLVAAPGEEGGVSVVVEDINKPANLSTAIKLVRKA